MFPLKRISFSTTSNKNKRVHRKNIYNVGSENNASDVMVDFLRGNTTYNLVHI